MLILTVLETQRSRIHRWIVLRGRVSFFEFQRYFSRLPESLLYQVFNQSLSIAWNIIIYLFARAEFDSKFFALSVQLWKLNLKPKGSKAKPKHCQGWPTWPTWWPPWPATTPTTTACWAAASSGDGTLCEVCLGFLWQYCLFNHHHHDQSLKKCPNVPMLTTTLDLNT